MKLNKIVALLLALVMVFSLAACGGETTEPTDTQAPTDSTAPAQPDPTEPVQEDPVVTDENVSIDFEDGNFGFVALYEGRANADASTLEVVEKYGNKALKVTNGSGKVPYVAFDVWSLLGENAANVASIEMTMGIENPDGKFYACSGKLMMWIGDKLSTTSYDWSVYLETKNPKLATFTLKDYEAFSAENPVAVLTLDIDNGATAGAANANLFVFNITFKDASGNVLTADSSATFTAPEGFAGSKDYSNLKQLKNTVSFDAMSGISSGAWSQNGVEMPEEFVAALVPGAVIEIEYTSTTGDLWIVMPWATAGWMRINAEHGVTPSYNNSKNIMQTTYEQIAAVCGEDVSTWGTMFQCESGGDWQVYSVKVGQDSGLVTTSSKTAVEGFSCSEGAWTQNGFELTAEQWAMLKPGTMLEVEYSSETGNLWAVLPWATAGWKRINAENGVTPNCNGSVLQVTYEQMAAVCGEDVSTWGTMLQFESDGAWEVYAVSICKAAVNVSGAVDLGIACSGTAWGQDGAELTAEQMALLVPGSVITINYTSTTGDMWIVLPDAPSWTRIEQQTANCDGETCWITFEQIAAVLGDDVSVWFTNGTRLQFESSGDWEVFAVSIGTGSGSAEAPDAGGNDEPSTDEPTEEIPTPEIPAVPEGAIEMYTGTTPMSGWANVTQVNTTVWDGTIDPATFTAGGYFSVYFTGKDVFSVHLIFNGNTWAQVDCDLANATDLGDGTYVATFSVEDLMAAYGSEDLSTVGAVHICSNSDAAGYVIVTLLTYTPAG